MAQREHPDLILMDIQLPVIDGYEATRRIRAIPELAKVPIIAVTSYALSGDEAKTREAGCDGYVAKPFSPRQLLAKVREFLPEYKHEAEFTAGRRRCVTAADPGRRRCPGQCRHPADAPRKPGLRGRRPRRTAMRALEKIRELLPDLVLLDIMMPKLDGIETVKRLKADAVLPFIPVILVTAKADAKDVIAGLEAGGDDYLTKPVDHAALSARVRAMLRIKALHDTVQEQARRLEEQAGELALWNKTLEERVAAQLGEIERMGR